MLSQPHGLEFCLGPAAITASDSEALLGLKSSRAAHVGEIQPFADEEEPTSSLSSSGCSSSIGCCAGFAACTCSNSCDSQGALPLQNRCRRHVSLIAFLVHRSLPWEAKTCVMRLASEHQSDAYACMKHSRRSVIILKIAGHCMRCHEARETHRGTPRVWQLIAKVVIVICVCPVADVDLGRREDGSL